MVIPKTLEECYVELNDTEGLLDWLKETEESATAIAHHSLGRWIRNNWGLWKAEGELFHFFKNNGIDQPDDMSGIILTSFHRHMNNKDIKLDEQFDHSIEFYLDDKQKLLRMRDKKLNKLNNA